VLALAIGESQVSLQITCGGGVAALRTLEGAIENEGSRRTLHTDLVARDVRITLGQLPAGLRESVRRIRIFGPHDLAQQLADEMELRFEPAGLGVELVTKYSPDEFGVQLPPDAPVSPAFSLAARLLAGQTPAFEFLPPKPTACSKSSRSIPPAGCAPPARRPPASSPSSADCSCSRKSSSSGCIRNGRGCRPRSGNWTASSSKSRNTARGSTSRAAA
jgi:hypothetical protein